MFSMEARHMKVLKVSLCTCSRTQGCCENSGWRWALLDGKSSSPASLRALRHHTEHELTKCIIIIKKSCRLKADIAHSRHRSADIAHSAQLPGRDNTLKIWSPGMLKKINPAIPLTATLYYKKINPANPLTATLYYNTLKHTSDIPEVITFVSLLLSRYLLLGHYD